MDNLPTEILHEVCKYLSPDDLRNVRYVNRCLSNVAAISFFRSVHVWVEAASLQKLQAITAHHPFRRYITEFAISTQEFGLDSPDRHQYQRGPWRCTSDLPTPRIGRLEDEHSHPRRVRVHHTCVCRWIRAWRRDPAHSSYGRANRARMIQWMSTWQKYLSDQTNMQLEERDIDNMSRALAELPQVHTVSMDNKKTLKMLQSQRQLGFDILVSPSLCNGHSFTVLVKALFLAHVRPTTFKVLSDMVFDDPYHIRNDLIGGEPTLKPYMCVFEALRAIDFCRISMYGTVWVSSDQETIFSSMDRIMESAPLLESMIFRICRRTAYEEGGSICITKLSRLWRIKTLKVLILEGLDGTADLIVELLGCHRSLKEVRLSNMRLYHGTWASVLDSLRSYCFTNLQTFCLHQVYDRIRQIFSKQELRARFGWDEGFKDEFWHESSNDWALDYVVGKIDFNPIGAQTDNWRRRDVAPQSLHRHGTSGGSGCLSVDGA